MGAISSSLPSPSPSPSPSPIDLRVDDGSVLERAHKSITKVGVMIRLDVCKNKRLSLRERAVQVSAHAVVDMLLENTRHGLVSVVAPVDAQIADDVAGAVRRLLEEYGGVRELSIDSSIVTMSGAYSPGLHVAMCVFI